MVFAKGGLVQDLHFQKFSEAERKKSRRVQIKSTRGYCIFEYLNIVYGNRNWEFRFAAIEEF